MTESKKTAGHTRFAGIRRRLEQWGPPSSYPTWIYELALFGFKQTWACLFGALMLALLLSTHLFYSERAWLARYDFLTVAALGIQIGLLTFRLETLREAKVIFAFHCVGTAMELFKTSVGSWTYPEQSFLRIGDVPLFSGFMYAAVGSYIARIWRIFDFRLEPYPHQWLSWLVAVAIYVNFFTHHWLPDGRYLLFAAIVALFWRTEVRFTVWRTRRAMPILLAWLLVTLFIWLAENISTFAQAWTYPDQANGWKPVSPSKLGSWYLLMYISFMLVAALHRSRAGRSVERICQLQVAPAAAGKEQRQVDVAHDLV